VEKPDLRLVVILSVKSTKLLCLAQLVLRIVTLRWYIFSMLTTAVASTAYCPQSDLK